MGGIGKDGPGAYKHDLNPADKLNQAMELRLSGMDWKPIADRLGYASAATLSRRVRALLVKRMEESADELLALEQSRLDALQEVAWRQAFAEDPDTTGDEGEDTKIAVAASANRLRAIETVLKVMERRAKLLGLDDAARRELEQTRRELTGEQAANVVGALTRIFAALGLSEEQKAMLSTIVPREMGRISREQDAIEGEIVEDEV